MSLADLNRLEVADTTSSVTGALVGNFDTLHAARATRQADPPKESNVVAVNFYWMGLPDSVNPVELRCIVSEI